MSASWDEFAQICADVLKARGEVRPIKLDQARDRLVVGDADGPVSFIHLLHARPEWEAAPLGARPRVLHRRFWSSIRSEAAASHEQVLKGVLPRVRDRAWFSAVRRQAELELGADESAIDEVMLPFEAINDELAAHLAYELPSSVTEIGPDRLEAWGLTFDDLYGRAKENLRAASQLPWEEAAPGVFVSPFHDSLDATRIVLPELFSAMKLKGKPVFLSPTHDIVFVTGDEDVDGLQQVAVWTEEALLEPRAHTAIAFRLVDGEWQRWLPEKGHPAFAKLKLLALQTTASAYSRQKEVLEALLESNGHEILVATLRAFRAPSGDVFTACAWQDGLEALLPQTDRIDFVRPGPGNTPSSAKVWSTTFEIARKTLGELMQPIGDLPERWRVKGFPTDEQLEQMALDGKI
jgi:hypothetical protein